MIIVYTILAIVLQNFYISIMPNLKTFIIFFFSVVLITSNISSKSISICHHKTQLNKFISQDTLNHKHCNQKKEKKLFAICFECECNQNQIQLIELSQFFEIEVENKNNITVVNNIDLFNPNNLDPPPKLFSS